MARTALPKRPLVGTIDCPHCHRGFEPDVDLTQNPRFQGAKCPACSLFVPWHRIRDLADVD